MSNCSLQHIHRILVVILVLIVNKSYGDYATALNSVPATGKYFLIDSYMFRNQKESSLNKK